MAARCSAVRATAPLGSNPEFNGWWSGRGFRAECDVPTAYWWIWMIFSAHFTRLPSFLTHGIWANQRVIHPQPAGIAVTDSSARFYRLARHHILRRDVTRRMWMRCLFSIRTMTAAKWETRDRQHRRACERLVKRRCLRSNFLLAPYIFHYDRVGAWRKWPTLRAANLDEVIVIFSAVWGAEQTAQQALCRVKLSRWRDSPTHGCSITAGQAPTKAAKR